MPCVLARGALPSRNHPPLNIRIERTITSASKWTTCETPYAKTDAPTTIVAIAKSRSLVRPLPMSPNPTVVTAITVQ